MAMFTKRLQERLGPEWTHLGMTGWRDPSGNVYRTGTDSNAERVAAAFLLSHHLGIGERGDDAFREALVDWLGIRNVSREDPRYGDRLSWPQYAGTCCVRVARGDYHRQRLGVPSTVYDVGTAIERMLADVPKTNAAPVVDEVGRTLFNSNGEPVAYAPHRLDSSWRERSPGVYETQIPAAALDAFGTVRVPLVGPRDPEIAAYSEWATRAWESIMSAMEKPPPPTPLSVADSIALFGEWSTVCACGARATRTREQPEAKAHRYVCAMGHQWTDGGAPLCKWCFAACYRDHYAKTWECEAHGGQE